MPIEMDQALEKIEAFSGLSGGLRSRLAMQAGMQRLSKGSILFCEGERADFVYGVVEGTVSLASGPTESGIVAEFMGPGDLLLVPPVLLGAPYMVSAQATNDLLVLMIPAKAFRQLAETEISLAIAINRLLSKHWRLLLRQTIQAKTHDADTRLKNYFLDFAGRSSGPAGFVLPGSKKDLAAHLGIRQETLSRALTRLTRLGVYSNGNSIEIDDLSRLRPEPATGGPH